MYSCESQRTTLYGQNNVDTHHTCMYFLNIPFQTMSINIEFHSLSLLPCGFSLCFEEWMWEFVYPAKRALGTSASLVFTTLCTWSIGTWLRIGLVMLVDGSLNILEYKVILDSWCASNFVATCWGRPKYECDGQVSIIFWPYSL